MSGHDIEKIQELLSADMTAVPGSPPNFAGANSESLPTLEGYQFLGRLGEGGMGTVWKAIQHSTRRTVALKLMSGGFVGSDRARQRFEREVELTAKLDHPNIARVFDGGSRQGVFFYAMQLIEGRDLAVYVREQECPRRQILELVELICRAVQHAHQKGVIHRDLKPSNVLVDDQGQPHVLDFGLAKALDSGQFISIDGEIAGTPAFMSPEQAAGKTDRMDTRSDVYSLGVILFHLLCGKYPHDVDGSAIEVMRRIAEQEPRRLGDIEPRPDTELQALVAKALEKEPNRRYASAGELADDLRRFLNHDPLIAQPPTLSYLLKKKLRRHRVRLSVAAAVMVLLIGVVVYAYARILHERNIAIAARVEKEAQHHEAERQSAVAERERIEANEQRQRVVQTLAALKATAPMFYIRSQTFVKRRDFAEALKNASFAADLVPDNAEYQLSRANALESLNRFDEAAKAYDAVLALQPDNEAAKQNRDLCHRIVEVLTERRLLTRDVLFELQSLMQRQKRFDEAGALLVRTDATEKIAGERVSQYSKILQDAGVKASVAYDRTRGFTLGWFGGDPQNLMLLRGLPLNEVTLRGADINDLTAFHGMPLTSLMIDSTSVSDLSPLVGMKLELLKCNNTKVSDLSPLRGMSIKTLTIGQTAVTSLEPLRGMPLEELNLGLTSVADLSALSGMPLKRLRLNGCGHVENIQALQGMRLEELTLGDTKVRDISMLEGMPLAILDLKPKNLVDIRPLRGMPLAQLQLSHETLHDADVLQSLGLLQRLDFWGATNADVVAVASARCTQLYLRGPLDALLPIHGKAIESLCLEAANLTDLTPLEGMPVKTLLLIHCKALIDLRPLLKCPQLELLTIPPQCREVEFLRTMRSLEYLQYDTGSAGIGPANATTAAEFWKQYDARKAGAK